MSSAFPTSTVYN